MKKILLISVLVLLSAPAWADCFLAKENNKIIRQEGECKMRHSPCSTFKVAIGLMGYEEGILLDETHPKFPFKKGYIDWMEVWRQPHDATMWMKNSCVWFSQVVTQKLGTEKFQNYMNKLNYGNRNISGGLMTSWISSSIKISPLEQINFMQKLAEEKLPLSLKSQQMVKNIIFTEEQNGWKIYGKTGSCNGDVKNGQSGWFVGFAEKGERRIIFANYIEEQGKQDYLSGRIAREEVKEKLHEIITGEK